MKGTHLSVLIAGTVCGSFLVNVAIMACGKVSSTPDGGGQAQADAPSTSATLPSGMIVAFGGAQTPEGWHLCDGSAISRRTYDAMFAAVGEAWGRGDGSTTFNVPDLRGRFLRGTDSGIGRDPDRIARIAINPGGNAGDAVGSLQADAIQGHAHSISHLLIAPADARGVPRLETSDQTASPYAFNTADIVADAAHGTPRVSAESRPQNANVTYIIKD